MISLCTEHLRFIISPGGGGGGVWGGFFFVAADRA